MKDFTAFVLGAGLGTRLRPLTSRRPKPLVPFFNKPLITFAFDHLLASGARRLVVNTHHCPEAYPDLLGGDGVTTTYRDTPVTFRHEPVLLDTGGGIRNVADLLGDAPFVVYNGDVLADFPLGPVLEAHAASGNVATLVLRSHGGPLHVQCEGGRVVDIRGQLGNTTAPSFLFTGVSVLSPEIFRHIPPGPPVSIIPVYLELIRQGAPVGGVVVDDGLWLDLGAVASYLPTHRLLAERPLSYLAADWIRPVHAQAELGVNVSVRGASAVGAGAVIGEGTVVEDSVIWENARVAPGSVIRSTVVCDGEQAGGMLADTIIPP